MSLPFYFNLTISCLNLEFSPHVISRYSIGVLSRWTVILREVTFISGVNAFAFKKWISTCYKHMLFYNFLLDNCQHYSFSNCDSCQISIAILKQVQCNSLILCTQCCRFREREKVNDEYSIKKLKNVHVMVCTLACLLTRNVRHVFKCNTVFLFHSLKVYLLTHFLRPLLIVLVKRCVFIIITSSMCC